MPLSALFTVASFRLSQNFFFGKRSILTLFNFLFYDQNQLLLDSLDDGLLNLGKLVSTF